MYVFFQWLDLTLREGLNPSNKELKKDLAIKVVLNYRCNVRAEYTTAATSLVVIKHTFINLFNIVATSTKPFTGAG